MIARLIFFPNYKRHFKMADNINIRNRSPNICPAGKHTDPHVSVGECMKIYPLDDTIDALKHEAKITDKEPMFKYKLPPLINSRNIGIFTEMKEILNKPVQTRFQTLINDLKETPYKSYWTAADGKFKDPIGNLPLSIDPYMTTFGKPTEKGITMKELVSPDKKYGQVLNEYIQGHDLYKKTHNDYYPNEHIDRKYLQPAYNPKKMFGERKGYEERNGVMMKCDMTANNKDNYSVVNTVLADYQNRSVPKLGKPLAPNKNIECLPEGHTFGRASIKQDSISELCSENPRPQITNEIEYLLTYVNPLRAYLKNRFNRNLFSFKKFLDALKYHDKNKSGWIPLSTAYEMCACFKLFYNKVEVEKFLTLFGIIQGDQIDYTKFVDVLNWQSDFIDISNTYHVTPEVQYYETTYRASQEDYKYINNTGCRAAGLPTVRLDFPQQRVPENGCRADLESMGTETDAQTIMYPSVYTSYGLSFYDFFMPREKDQIRKIFTNVGYVLDDDTFEKMWAEGCESDKTGLVCAETFKNLIKKYKVEYKNEKKDE